MRHPIIKLPKKIEMALFLIQAELKNRKFFNGLRGIGLDDCEYQCDFNAAIADCMGFDNTRDEDFKSFDEIMEKYSNKISPDDDSIMKHAFDVYIELSIEKKKQQRREQTVES